MSHSSSSDPKRQPKSSSSGRDDKPSASGISSSLITENMKRNIGGKKKKSGEQIKPSPSHGKADKKSPSTSSSKTSLVPSVSPSKSSAHPSSVSSSTNKGHPGSSSSSSGGIGPVSINSLFKLSLLQRSVGPSRLVKTSSGNGGKGGGNGKKSAGRKSSSLTRRSRIRVDPRTLKHNDNLPVEASADHIHPQKESPVANSPLVSFDSALVPENLYNKEVLYEFSEPVMHMLKGTACDPEMFLKPASQRDTKTKGGVKYYLDRKVDPQKLINYLVKYMKSYYDLKKNGDAYSSDRQKMDNVLWDNLAFIIPMLCRNVIDVLEKEPMIITDVQPDAVVIGDIHGNFTDIHYIYQNFIDNPQYAQTKFVFLGDYVDRGPKPVEILCFLFALKLANPKRFILLRGNHEVLKINRKYGFQHMCCHLFLDTYIAKPTLAELNYKSFNRVFCYLPVAAVIKGAEKRIFCCHGGVPAYFTADRSSGRNSKHRKEMDVGWSIATLNAKVTKPVSLEPSKHGKVEDVACNEILWNDPLPQRLRNRYPRRKYFRNRKRGGHCNFFSESGLRAFLETNGLSMVIRGHQFKTSIKTGHHYDFSGTLLTIFSSSNYCGTEKNTTGYAHVKGPECHVEAHILRKAEEAEKYRQFNVLKMLVDDRTMAVTFVAF